MCCCKPFASGNPWSTWLRQHFTVFSSQSLSMLQTYQRSSTLVSIGINSRAGMNLITSLQIYMRGEAQVTSVSNLSALEIDTWKLAWEHLCACQSHFPATARPSPRLSTYRISIWHLSLTHFYWMITKTITENHLHNYFNFINVCLSTGAKILWLETT